MIGCYCVHGLTNIQVHLLCLNSPVKACCKWQVFVAVPDIVDLFIIIELLQNLLQAIRYAISLTVAGNTCAGLGVGIVRFEQQVQK